MEDLNVSSGLLVYPSFFKVSLEQGKEYSFKVNIDNQSVSDITIEPSVAEFNQDKNTNQNQLKLSQRYKSWFSLKSIIAESGKVSVLEIKLKIPSGEILKESSFYPAIILKQAKNEDSEATIVTAEHVIPIYIDLLETRKVSASIEKFDISKEILGVKISIETKILNNGNTYFTPTSYIEFHQVNILNNEKKIRIEAVPVTKNEPTLLPESYVLSSTDWKRSKFGKYEASLYVLSENTKLESASVPFWIIPKQMIFYTSAFILMCGIVFILIKRHFKRPTLKSL